MEQESCGGAIGKGTWTNTGNKVDFFSWLAKENIILFWVKQEIFSFNLRKIKKHPNQTWKKYMFHNPTVSSSIWLGPQLLNSTFSPWQENL